MQKKRADQFFICAWFILQGEFMIAKAHQVVDCDVPPVPRLNLGLNAMMFWVVTPASPVLLYFSTGFRRATCMPIDSEPSDI